MATRRRKRTNLSGMQFPTLDQLKDQMTEAIRDARERPPVDDVTPGKFSGPLA